MGKDYDNFIKWFKEPLECLYKNEHTGFAIVMLSLPLLERYLRQKSRVYENQNLDPRFYQEFLKMFQLGTDEAVARKFWAVYRHGLLHQATLKAYGAVLGAAVHGGAAEIEFKGDIFTVSPVKFSEHVIRTIEGDFGTYEGPDSPNHPPPWVDESSGRSGWNPDVK